MRMSLRTRLLDLLPIMVVAFAVSAFTTYVAVAYILHDPWWIQTVAELRRGG